jgi:hypothetical protein
MVLQHAQRSLVHSVKRGVSVVVYFVLLLPFTHQRSLLQCYARNTARLLGATDANSAYSYLDSLRGLLTMPHVIYSARETPRLMIAVPAAGV